MFEGLP